VFQKTRNHRKWRLLENAQMLGTARLAPRCVHKGTQASKRSRDNADGRFVTASFSHKSEMPSEGLTLGRHFALFGEQDFTVTSSSFMEKRFETVFAVFHVVKYRIHYRHNY
jgi:hypothetical protein